ncbi:hypothetical protein [Microbacterium marmarense]|uniref:Helix-turn-helix domain-containing protein n=1 Tax=Microbacterium marmarense TaxID=3122051 RepID=A0ABU8LU44_9MICO
MTAEHPDLMTVADVAVRFGVSESTVRVWLTHRDAGATGGVPSVLPAPLARGVVWMASEIEAIAPVVEARSRKGGRPRTKVQPKNASSEDTGPDNTRPEDTAPEDTARTA